MHEPIKNMQVLAKGYMVSALELAKGCLHDNSDKKADIIVFPMLFSANQGIELYEKSIYWSMNILLENKKPYPDNHKIREIWYSVKEKIRKYGFDKSAGRGKDEFDSMVITLEKYLDELYMKIGKDGDINTAFHNIDFSRYPLNNRREAHFYINEIDNVVIDLENFLMLMEDIYKCLDRLAGYYYELVLLKWSSEE